MWGSTLSPDCSVLSILVYETIPFYMKYELRARKRQTYYIQYMHGMLSKHEHGRIVYFRLVKLIVIL